MLDTYGRKYIEGFINKLSNLFIKAGFTPNSVTFMSLITGVASGLMLYLDLNVIAVVILWISGALDSIDGSMARILKQTSSIGTLLDITFDRVVELSIILAISFKLTDTRIYLILLLASILLSMTIFLTVGALTQKKGMKSFYYQAGIAERSEGFIMLSLMMLFEKQVNVFIIIFILLITITIIQRLVEAKKIL